MNLATLRAELLRKIMSIDKHAGNVILLRTASLTLLIALALAWCLAFTSYTDIPLFVETFKNKDSLLSAHLDYLMMTMLLLGFYASKITLPKYVLWAMAVGSFTNPSFFVLGALSGDGQALILPPLIFIGLLYSSFTLTTFGYGMAAIKVFRFSLKD